METTSVSSLRKKRERQLENQKQQNLTQGLNMKQIHERHDSEQLVEKRICLTLMLEKANILQAADGGGNGFMFPFQETVSLLGSVVMFI